MAQTFIDPMHVVTATITLVDKGQYKTITTYLPTVPRVGEVLNFGTKTIEGSWKVSGVAYEIFNSPELNDAFVCNSVQVTAEQVD